VQLVIEKPRLPNYLTAPVGAFGFVFCAYSLLLFAIPALLSIVIWESDTLLWGKVVFFVLLWSAAQQGLHLLGLVGHEGLHGNLHRNRLLSVHLGMFFSSMATGFLVVGYYMTHWDHHLYTNTLEDPDVGAYTRFKSFWSRLVLSRMYQTKAYRRNTLALAFGRGFPGKRLPYGFRKLRVFARFNLAYHVIWIAIYALIGFVDPMWFVVAILVPYIAVVGASGLRVYIEHAGTDAEVGTNARSFSSHLWTILFFGNNLHLEHHLYPHVPCYRLPALHRWLREQGFFHRNGSFIEPYSAGAFKYAAARYAYPSGGERSVDEAKSPSRGSFDCLSHYPERFATRPSDSIATNPRLSASGLATDRDRAAEETPATNSY
jgi:beta-carotene hydroxylase